MPKPSKALVSSGFHYLGVFTLVPGRIAKPLENSGTGQSQRRCSKIPTPPPYKSKRPLESETAVQKNEPSLKIGQNYAVLELTSAELFCFVSYSARSNSALQSK